MTDFPQSRWWSDRVRQVRATFPHQTSVPQPGLITLSSGTPDFPTPPHVVEAGRKALADGHTAYTPWAGIMPLREAIAEKMERVNGVKVNPGSEVIVTTGTQEALIAILLAFLNPGEEMLIAAPFYDEYRRDAWLAGADLVPVPTSAHNSYELDPATLEAHIGPKTKGIILVSPNNPTAAVFRPATVKAIAKIAQEHDLLVVSDELYEMFVYDDATVTSIASLPGMKERTITINGFSKGYSMTGWRVGYIVADAGLIQAILPIHHGLTICAPAVSQWAALAAITGPHDWFVPVLAEYDRRRRTWMAALDKMGLPYGRPRGAYYILIDITGAGLDSPTFSRTVRDEAGVVIGGGGGAVDPSTLYTVRGAFTSPLDKLEEGLARMARVVERLREKAPVVS
ncbi:MAG: aminotransferase class I/II-fold pyridoxal phosphate-dependent enzyme [Anaerolineae bacterium]|nr:aminotransferase class I/II-fold pyridoxal phosphate-dependent enzyme [Anaerolineae bacterium]